MIQNRYFKEVLMKRGALSAILAVGLISVLSASAHEGENHEAKVHVMGTVTAIHGDHIQIKTIDGTAVLVTVTQATRFVEAGDAPADATAVQAGSRVMVDTVASENGEMIAAKVMIGRAPRGDAIPDSPSVIPPPSDAPHGSHTH